MAESEEWGIPVGAWPGTVSFIRSEWSAPPFMNMYEIFEQKTKAIWSIHEESKRM